MSIEKDIQIDYSAIDREALRLVEETSKYMTFLSRDEIEDYILKAYEYAKNAHHGTMRLSGDPYIVHPVEATFILLTLKPDIYTIQACLMHDVIEDTSKTYEDIKEIFGKTVADLCEGMEKLGKVRYYGEERSIGSLRKMFIAMSEDIRVIFIKLSDRLHNMRTLKYHPKPEKRNRIALETLNIYAPIADRLGLFWFKNELDKECFEILEPEKYQELEAQLEASKDTIDTFKESAKKEIDELLSGSGLKYKVDFRIKSIYSIYKKMERKDISDISDLYDLYGVKILVDSIENCYRVLGMIHNKWIPVPKRFKDYIALPKPNGYRSLHTTILGMLKNHRRQPTEIQIKTYDMDIQANIGIRAHFEYKERGSKASKDIEWVHDLKSIASDLGNNDFMDSLKIDLFGDRIFVLTPNGESINLPNGSTPIDFAYTIHTKIGDHASIAKVNQKPVSLDKELKNGDVVEIITDKNKTPNPFYLSFVKTTKAKSSIKSYIRSENKEKHIERGKEILNSLLTRAGLDPLDKDLTQLRELDGKNNPMSERFRLLEQIGNFAVNPTSVLKKILKRDSPDSLEKRPKIVKEIVSDILDDKLVSKSKNIVIGGEKGLPYKIRPSEKGKLGDKIVRYINSRGVFVIYNRDSKALSRLSKDRLLSAYYEGEEDNTSIFKVELELKNEIGILKEISDILFKMNLNVVSISSKNIGNDSMMLSLGLEALDYDYLIVDRFIDRVKFAIGNKLVIAQKI